MGAQEKQREAFAATGLAESTSDTHTGTDIEYVGGFATLWRDSGSVCQNHNLTFLLTHVLVKFRGFRLPGWEPTQVCSVPTDWR